MTGRLSSPDGLPPTAGYSHVAAVPAGARLVITAGQIALDAGGAVVGAGDAGAQTRQVMANLARALAGEGARLADVVKLTIFVVDLGDLPAIRAARDEFIDTARPPVSSLVQVAGLVHPDLRVEIEAIAAVGG